MSGKTGINLGILAGVAIGVGIGILLAPDKGSETRKKLKGTYDDAEEKLKTKFNAATSGLREKASKIDLQGSYEELVATVNSKGEEVISFLEDKLNTLKAEASKYKTS